MNPVPHDFSKSRAATDKAEATNAGKAPSAASAPTPKAQDADRLLVEPALPQHQSGARPAQGAAPTAPEPKQNPWHGAIEVVKVRQLDDFDYLG